MPALPDIGAELRCGARPTSVNWSFPGCFSEWRLALWLYGPVSDSVGRKRPVYTGFALFTIGTLISLFAVSFTMMMVGRVLQGIGIAGPRIISNAIVRDLYRGRDMARVMSLVMVVFILVPASGAYGRTVCYGFRWLAGHFRPVSDSDCCDCVLVRHQTGRNSESSKSQTPVFENRRLMMHSLC